MNAEGGRRDELDDLGQEVENGSNRESNGIAVKRALSLSGFLFLVPLGEPLYQ